MVSAVKSRAIDLLFRRASRPRSYEPLSGGLAGDQTGGGQGDGWPGGRVVDGRSGRLTGRRYGRRQTGDALARLNVLNQGALPGLRKDSFDPRKFFGPCWQSPQTPDTTLAAWIRDLKA